MTIDLSTACALELNNADSKQMAVIARNFVWLVKCYWLLAFQNILKHISDFGSSMYQTSSGLSGAKDREMTQKETFILPSLANVN